MYIHICTLSVARSFPFCVWVRAWAPAHACMSVPQAYPHCVMDYSCLTWPIHNKQDTTVKDEGETAAAKKTPKKRDGQFEYQERDPRQPKLVEGIMRKYQVLCVAVWCNVVQCVAVYCSVLQCLAVSCSVLQCVAVFCCVLPWAVVCYSALQCAAVCCSVLQCAAVCWSALQCAAVCWEGIIHKYLELAMHCVAVYCIMLLYVSKTLCASTRCVCCSALQCAAVFCRLWRELRTSKVCIRRQIMCVTSTNIHIYMFVYTYIQYIHVNILHVYIYI